jgi:hypothetical protein
MPRCDTSAKDAESALQTELKTLEMENAYYAAMLAKLTGERYDFDAPPMPRVLKIWPQDSPAEAEEEAERRNYN